MHLEDQALEDEMHVVELIDLKKQLLRTKVYENKSWICAFGGSIISNVSYAVTLCAFVSKDSPFFFQNDLHQLRQNITYLEKQVLEEEVHNPQEQTSEQEVCVLLT